MTVAVLLAFSATTRQRLHSIEMNDCCARVVPGLNCRRLAD